MVGDFQSYNLNKFVVYSVVSFDYQCGFFHNIVKIFELIYFWITILYGHGNESELPKFTKEVSKYNFIKPKKIEHSSIDDNYRLNNKNIRLFFEQLPDSEFVWLGSQSN